MSGSFPWSAVLVPAGIVLLALTLADVFFTVLFPGSGHGPLRRPLARLTVRAFRVTARRLPRARRRALLGYSGPVLIALSIAVWPVLLICGWALVYFPALGHGIVASSGATDRTWSAALYVSGFSLSTLGTGDLVPQTGLYRWLMVTEAVMGFAVVTMVISYFLSVYSAVVTRKTFAAGLDHRTHRTGDSARLIAGLAAQDDLSAVVGQLASTGESLLQLFETHRSYPVLRYFHYREVRYSLPRILLVCLDAAALLPSALDGARYGKVAGSPALAVVDGAARELLDALAPSAEGCDDADERRWRARFRAAVDCFREAGLAVRDDAAATEEYVRRRGSWEPRLRALAAGMVYDWDEIEPASGAGSGPPLRTAGERRP